MPIACDKKQLSLIDILQSLLTTDTNGNCGIRLIPVADGNADFPDCDFKHLDDLASIYVTRNSIDHIQKKPHPEAISWLWDQFCKKL